MKSVCNRLVLLILLLHPYSIYALESEVAAPPEAGMPAPADPSATPVNTTSNEMRDRSVYHINPAIDGPILGITAITATIPEFTKERLGVDNRCPCDREDVNRFDRAVIGNNSKTASTASHLVVGMAIAAPIVLDIKDLGFNKTLAEDIVVFFETLAINSTLSQTTRFLVERPRPTAYHEDSKGTPPTDAGSFLSFYSGHVASTFAALSAASMTYGYRYGHRVWPWVVTATLGSADAGLRVAAGGHFHTDNIVGAIMGTAVGITVPMLHRRNSDSQVTLVPYVTDRGAQVLLRRKF